MSKTSGEFTTPPVRSGRPAAVDLSRKLRLVMHVLGCPTQKELCTRLTTVNPGTGYRPDRAYKWIQGRATPRDLSVYDDLARVLDAGLDGETVRRCSYAEFHRQLVRRYGDRVPRESAAGETARATAKENVPEPGRPAAGYLAGRFIGLSRAWSVYQPTGLIAAAITLRRADPSGVQMEYAERLPGGDLSLSGTLRRFGRSLHALLASDNGEVLVTTVFGMPPPPAPVLAGIMAGLALHDAEPRPVGGRLVCLRVPDGDDDPRAWSGYLEASPAPLVEKLADAGFPPDVARRLAPELLSLATLPDDRGLIEVKVSAVNTMMGAFLNPVEGRNPRAQLPSLSQVDVGP